MHFLFCEFNNMLLNHPDIKVMIVSEIGVDALLLPQVQN